MQSLETYSGLMTTAILKMQVLKTSDRMTVIPVSVILLTMAVWLCWSIVKPTSPALDRDIANSTTKAKLASAFATLFTKVGTFTQGSRNDEDEECYCQLQIDSPTLNCFYNKASSCEGEDTFQLPRHGDALVAIKMDRDCSIQISASGHHIDSMLCKEDEWALLDSPVFMLAAYNESFLLRIDTNVECFTLLFGDFARVYRMLIHEQGLWGHLNPPYAIKDGKVIDIDDLGTNLKAAVYLDGQTLL